MKCRIHLFMSIHNLIYLTRGVFRGAMGVRPPPIEPVKSMDFRGFQATTARVPYCLSPPLERRKNYALLPGQIPDYGPVSHS